RSNGEIILIHHLKISHSRALDLLYPLAGRFATTYHHHDNTISFFVDCNTAGVDFVHVAADGVSVADILEPIYVLENIEGTSKTFLEVQVAKLKNRIFLACSTNISLVDGTSIWQFFQSWSEIRRGFSFDSIATSISTPPVLECWFPRNIDCPILIPKEKLSLQQLVACNQPLDPEVDVNCLLSIGVRTRLQPQLPQEYVGNIVQTGRDNESESEYGTGSNASAISNSPRFDVYGNDFGWGKPIAVTGGSASKRNGKATTSARVEKASADIEIRLSVETLQRLQNDAQFMDAASVIT
ncbi:hypothetical protein CICLE_v10033639mg, partial [Citrus x clementina]